MSQYNDQHPLVDFGGDNLGLGEPHNVGVYQIESLELKVGDRVRYNDKCEWKPWVGATGTVVRVWAGWLSVDFSENEGKMGDKGDFSRGPHTCTNGQVSKI